MPDGPEPLRAQLAYWLGTQPRFADCIEKYVDKIRRKFRLAQTDEDARDILAELETVHRFTANPDYRVTYEPYGAKGCDFRIDTPSGKFNAETIGGVYPILYTQKESFKFTDLLLDSLHQLTGDVPNVLIIRSHSTTHHAEELPMAVCEIHEHVFDRNEAFFQRKRFAGIQDYQDKIALLSAAVVITGTRKAPDCRPRNLVWVNPAAAKRLNETILEYFAQM